MPKWSNRSRKIVIQLCFFAFFFFFFGPFQFQTSILFFLFDFLFYRGAFIGDFPFAMCLASSEPLDEEVRVPVWESSTKNSLYLILLNFF